MHYYVLYVGALETCWHCSIGPPSFPPALRETRKKKINIHFAHVLCLLVYTVILRETKIHSFQGFKIKGQ